MSQAHYEELVKIILVKLRERNEWQTKIDDLSKAEERSRFGLVFSVFFEKETRDEFVSRLLTDIDNINATLAIIAGRHEDRHREIVDLLVERFELKKFLDHHHPSGNAGWKTNCEKAQRFQEVEKLCFEITGLELKDLKLA